MTYLNQSESTPRSLSYTIECGDCSEAATSLRHKIDSLGILFDGLAENCGYNQSALIGVLLILHDIQKHAAALEERLNNRNNQENLM